MFEGEVLQLALFGIAVFGLVLFVIALFSSKNLITFGFIDHVLIYAILPTMFILLVKVKRPTVLRAVDPRCRQACFDGDHGR